MGLARKAAFVLALAGVTLASTGDVAEAQARPYTAGATAACLVGLADSVAGLPPAAPPAAHALFVYSFPPDRVPAGARGTLGAWQGRKGDGYRGVTLVFFGTAGQAERAAKSVQGPWGGELLRNVVVGWDIGVPGRSLRGTVLGCLRAGSAGAGIPTRPAPRAGLATLAGYWGGHTRGLRIGAGGRGAEGVSSGCCHREYDLTFRILSVTGTLTRATATYRVTSFERYDPALSRVEIGRTGRLLLRNGILTNTLTKVYFCSVPTWDATGACGA